MTRPCARTIMLSAAFLALLVAQRGACAQIEAPWMQALPALAPSRLVRACARRVHALDYSRDGKLLASAGGDAKVKIWQPNTGRCLQVVNTQTDCVAFSPNSRWLATGSWDSGYPRLSPRRPTPAGWLVRVWNVRTGRLAHALAGHHGAVETIDWSPNGRWLATGSDDGSVRLWSTATWRSVVTLREPFPFIQKGDEVVAREVRFSGDGKLLAVVSVVAYEGAPGSTTYRVGLWDAASWKRRRTFQGEPRRDSAVALFPPHAGRLQVELSGPPFSSTRKPASPWPRSRIPVR